MAQRTQVSAVRCLLCLPHPQKEFEFFRICSSEARTPVFEKSESEVSPAVEHDNSLPVLTPNSTVVEAKGQDNPTNALYISLGYHLNTGHTLSVQHRPTGLPEDVIGLPC